MSNEVVEVVQECSKMCGIIQGSYFATVDGVWNFVGKNWWNAEAIRNIILLIGLGFLGWRAISAKIQADTAIKQANTAQSQLDVAQRGQQNERYQSAAAMLGSKRLMEREAAIFSLSILAQEDMENYYFIVQKILCQFVRQECAKQRAIWKKDSVGARGTYPEAVDDVHTTLKELGKMNRARFDLLDKNPQIEGISAAVTLEGVDLAGYKFVRLFLWQFNFRETKLTGAEFRNCDLNETFFDDCKCTGTKFFGKVDGKYGEEVLGDLMPMRNAQLKKTMLRAVKFYGVDLSETEIHGGEMSAIQFEDCKLVNANFQPRMFQRIKFSEIRDAEGLYIPSDVLKECKDTGNSHWFDKMKRSYQAAVSQGDEVGKGD